MKLYNYLKVFGAFTNAYQTIALDVEPKDRQERKMLEEANQLLAAGWSRRSEFLSKQEGKTGESVDMVAEKEKFFPAMVDGKLAMPLQYVQDYMVRKMAAVQNNTSIHNTKEVAELKEVFDDYGVELTGEFKGLIFERINWTAKPGQKPKLLVHAKEVDGEEVCIRFEAAGELCQKFLMAVLELELKQGQAFSLKVEAVDPAIARNAKAGKKVAEVGVYVNHNMLLTVGSKTHTGHPPKGQRFVQKPTMEFMETLFNQALHVVEAKAA